MTNYSYDANRNMLSAVVMNATGGIASSEEYIYSGFNQLIVHTDTDNVKTTYAYDSSGLRVSKNGTGYIWDAGSIVAEVENGEAAATYLRGMNLIRSDVGGAESYYLYNAHGDVVQLTDSRGTVTKRYDYDAFGNETDPDDAGTNPFRYCGEYYDTETETYYLRARNYDPSTGRFTSEDPIRNGLNWYTYCGNSPVMLIDPSGLKDIAVRSTIEGLGGTVRWNSRTNTAIIYLDGKSTTVYAGDNNGSYIDKYGRMHTDDAWLFAALGSIFDLGKGWTGRMERHGIGDGYQRHVHVYKGDKSWSQNEDGSPHDQGGNSPGSPPSSVLKSLNKKKGWDWKGKENDWQNKIEVQYLDSGYTVIVYPNGRQVTVYKPLSWYTMQYSPSTQNFRDYYYGPTYVDLSGGSSVTKPSVPFLPMPNPVPIPVPAPVPIPIPVW